MKPREISRSAVLFELIILGGIYIFWKEFASAAGILELLPAMPIVERSWISFTIVLATLGWLCLRRADLRDYGLKKPRSFAWLSVWAIVIIILEVAESSLTEPILHEKFGAPNITAFENITGNLPLFLYVLPFIWLFAAFGEEYFYRAFLMTSLAQVLGGTRAAWAAALIAQSVIFGLAHAYQGVSGAIGTGIAGLVYGAGYMAAGRMLWPPMIAHGLLNTLGFTLLYLGVIEA